MDNKDVPYIVHEGDMARMERTIKRLWITNIILILLFVGSNVAWLMYESQFEETSTTTNEVTQELDSGDGGDAILNGDVNIGEGKKNSKDNDN
jgi:hypothetical protein